uniref:HTH three-helical bundle domain-containing protein n=1 Tax=Salix viminalis TaxID=40686 RepID=A0A6N2LES4_SALVM
MDGVFESSMFICRCPKQLLETKIKEIRVASLATSSIFHAKSRSSSSLPSSSSSSAPPLSTIALVFLGRRSRARTSCSCKLPLIQYSASVKSQSRPILEMNYFSHVTSGSKLCVSSLTNDVSSFKEIQAHKLRIVAIVSRCYEMKPKVARRKRSKRTNVVARLEKAAEALTESGLCLSSSCSSASSARNHHMKRKGLPSQSNIEAVASDAFSKMRIRQVLGDSSSANKALRMLLRHDEVKRSGKEEAEAAAERGIF